MEHQLPAPNPWMILPFGVLLTLIAVAPFFFPQWWHRHYPKIALGLGTLTLVYYLFGLHAYERVMAVAHEYVGFIALIGSLYIVAGGIRIDVNGRATPVGNTAFLLAGALLANVLGTTGASMVLIRPWIRMNRHRIAAHHIVFFIFIVSNVGGCLTPIGDPPLFLGYLIGVPFWWVAANCWPMWATCVFLLLGIFFVVDQLDNARKRHEQDNELQSPGPWKVEGLSNLFFMAVILGAVFVSKPHYIREAVMLAAAAGSYFTTQRRVREANGFTFGPVVEVAVLFIGIFSTMIPALDWLARNAGMLLGQNPTPQLFYWSTGMLSSVLDNAPTYLSFVNALFGSKVDEGMMSQILHLVQSGGTSLVALTGSHAEEVRNTILAMQRYYADELAARTITIEHIEVCFIIGNASANNLLAAISVGAVFFGATTYIGNGPNFMVKSIAEEEGAPAPSFLGFLFRYAVPFVLPVLLVVWFLFFR